MLTTLICNKWGRIKCVKLDIKKYFICHVHSREILVYLPRFWHWGARMDRPAPWQASVLDHLGQWWTWLEKSSGCQRKDTHWQNRPIGWSYTRREEYSSYPGGKVPSTLLLSANSPFSTALPLWANKYFWWSWKHKWQCQRWAQQSRPGPRSERAFIMQYNIEGWRDAMSAARWQGDSSRKVKTNFYGTIHSSEITTENGLMHWPLRIVVMIHKSWECLLPFSVCWLPFQILNLWYKWYDFVLRTKQYEEKYSSVM